MPIRVIDKIDVSNYNYINFVKNTYRHNFSQNYRKIVILFFERTILSRPGLKNEMNHASSCDGISLNLGYNLW